MADKSLSIHGETSDFDCACSKTTHAIVENIKSPLEMPSWEELQARVNKTIVYLMYAVEPLELRNKIKENHHLIYDSRLLYMSETVMLPVFRHLSVNELLVAMRVCKAWVKVAIHPSLWKNINIGHKTIEPVHLIGVVRRQPENLKLNWADIHKEHLLWLLERLPKLCKLHLQGQTWEVVRQLNSTHCPPLAMLDLSYTEDLTDTNLRRLLSPPNCVRSFHAHLTTRLISLKELHLAGTPIRDEGVGCVAKFLPSLTCLNVRSCLSLTDMSAVILSHPETPIRYNLSYLDMRGCNRLTYASLDYFQFLPSLQKLALYPCIGLPLRLIRHWGRRNGYSVSTDKLLEKIR